MEKPAVITITDDRGEVVYMQFINMESLPIYREVLGRVVEDSVEVKTAEGETFYNMPDYVKNLITKGTKD